MFKKKRQKRIIAGQINVLDRYKKILFILVLLLIAVVLSSFSLMFLTIVETNNIETAKKDLDRILVKNSELKSKYLSLKSNIVDKKKGIFVAANDIKYLNTKLQGFAINFKRK